MLNSVLRVVVAAASGRPSDEPEGPHAGQLLGHGRLIALDIVEGAVSDQKFLRRLSHLKFTSTHTLLNN